MGQKRPLTGNQTCSGLVTFQNCGKINLCPRATCIMIFCGKKNFSFLLGQLENVLLLMLVYALVSIRLFLKKKMHRDKKL